MNKQPAACALAAPVAWPCEIEEADFERGVVRLKMRCADYKVGAGLHWLHTAPPRAIPPGYKLVPVEPTPAMLVAINWPNDPAGYRAMLAAAPQPSAEPVAWMQESTEVIRSDWGFDKRGYIPLYAAPQPAAVPAEDAIEAAYWDFDARHKGYGPHKTMPQSERDAFKWAVRAMLAAAIRALKERLK